MLIPSSHLVAATYYLIIIWGVRRVADFRSGNEVLSWASGFVSAGGFSGWSLAKFAWQE